MSKGQKRKVHIGAAYINASFNNTLIVYTDQNGNKLYQTSAGAAGYRGSRKSTPFAAEEAARESARHMKDAFGMTKIAVYIKGPGSGRESSIRGIRNGGLQVIRITDRTGVPHNGVRPRKKRRC
jgi:small subunit ribosomal protein S11